VLNTTVSPFFIQSSRSFSSSVYFLCPDLNNTLTSSSSLDSLVDVTGITPPSSFPLSSIGDSDDISLRDVSRAFFSPSTLNNPSGFDAARVTNNPVVSTPVSSLRSFVASPALSSINSRVSSPSYSVLGVTNFLFQDTPPSSPRKLSVVVSKILRVLKVDKFWDKLGSLPSFLPGISQTPEGAVSYFTRASSHLLWLKHCASHPMSQVVFGSIITVISTMDLSHMSDILSFLMLNQYAFVSEQYDLMLSVAFHPSSPLITDPNLDSVVPAK
jgi:hypothetical protein